MKTSCKIIADSINIEGARITTFEVCAPRFLLAEVNTHRVIARSAASSRAIPVKKRIQMVLDEPFIPLAFGKNRPGMQAIEVLSETDTAEARAIWEQAAESAAYYAEKLEALSVHKQTANRLLEPFVYYTGVMTGTEWDNFFILRNHADAQPEFKELAQYMQEHYITSKPEDARYHLPYVRDDEKGRDLTDLFAISAARCARVSYNTFDGKLSKAEDDLKLCSDLIKSGHLSPFDHPATTDVSVMRTDNGYAQKFWDKPEDHRHLWGWIPHRVGIERLMGRYCARNSYAEIT